MFHINYIPSRVQKEKKTFLTSYTLFFLFLEAWGTFGGCFNASVKYDFAVTKNAFLLVDIVHDRGGVGNFLGKMSQVWDKRHYESIVINAFN